VLVFDWVVRFAPLLLDKVLLHFLYDRHIGLFSFLGAIVRPLAYDGPQRVSDLLYVLIGYFFRL